MTKKQIGWGKEIIQAGSDISELAKDVGIPGIGLLARFARSFYDNHLQKRFEKFISDSEIDSDLISKISNDETYSNCFYGILETVRQTHSKIGLIALALIYKEHWNDEPFIVAAAQDFSQISDKTINAFITLYESIPDDEKYLKLQTYENFHELFNEGVELIRRNFFIMSSGAGGHRNNPVQGIKWDHTDSYYKYCKAAKARA